ncbi:MAG TPA: hypothetical protein VMI53_07490 [Opitutaceae bacterium]|nr:hypothetical protein [Opitutaceae bacterium]
MKKLLFNILLASLISLAGCTSVKPWLWNPPPKSIIVPQQLTLKGDVFGMSQIIVPAGTYNYLGATEDYFIYVSSSGAKFHLIGYMENDAGSGFILSRRLDVVSAAEVFRKTDDLGRMTGIPAWVIGSNIEKYGFDAAPLGPPLSPENRVLIGLPAQYPASR